MDTTEEQERLEAMVEDDGTTWDLSLNDKAAIQWALDQIAKEFDPPAPDVYPIFDILQRLWGSGYTTKEQDDQWWLLGPRGECIMHGRTFRDLCVNIVLAGIDRGPMSLEVT